MAPSILIAIQQGMSISSTVKLHPTPPPDPIHPTRTPLDPTHPLNSLEPPHPQKACRQLANTTTCQKAIHQNMFLGYIEVNITKIDFLCTILYLS